MIVENLGVTEDTDSYYLVTNKLKIINTKQATEGSLMT